MESADNQQRIAVIVPVYRVEKQLPRCVQSILTQTHRDFSLVLIDDGSPDGCAALCDAYAAEDARIHVIHQRNRGVSAARNAGIEWALRESGCEWLSFVDSDDWVHPQYLELLLAANLRFGTKISTVRYHKAVDGEKLLPIEPQRMRRVSPEECFFTAKGDFEAYAWGRLYAAECFRTLRFPEGKVWEDLYLLPPLLFAQESIAEAESVLYYYYVNANGIVLSEWSPRQLDEIDACAAAVDFFKTCRDGRFYGVAALRYLSAIERQILRIRTAYPRVESAKEQYFVSLHRQADAMLDECLRRDPAYLKSHYRMIPLRWMRADRFSLLKGEGAAAMIAYLKSRCSRSLYVLLHRVCTLLLGSSGFEKLKQWIRRCRPVS